MHNPADHWLTVDQTADVLSLTAHHVYRRIRSGVLPSTTLGSTLVIPREWVDAAKATRTTAASRTRIDWAAASAAYELSIATPDNPTTPHYNDATPGSRITRHEHAHEPLPAPPAR